MVLGLAENHPYLKLWILKVVFPRLIRIEEVWLSSIKLVEGQIGLDTLAEIGLNSVR